MPAGRAKFAEVLRSSVARRGVAIMGICNVTPDSFSDGGQFFDANEHGGASGGRARAHVEALISEGADFIDIGGESTRPGAKPVAAREQLERVLDLVTWASSRTCVSIDTTNAEVAAACLDAGAHAVNDVSLLTDPELAHVTAARGGALILSHARAPQETMRGYGQWRHDDYRDIVDDVVDDWMRAATRACERGVPRDALVMDPGLGFSKASRHSFDLLRRASELVAKVRRAWGDAELPVLFGASRKSFLTLVDPTAEPGDRLGASVAAAMFAAKAGVRILRVHDVRATRQAIDLDIAVRTTPGHADRGNVPLGPDVPDRRLRHGGDVHGKNGQGAG